ncbi:hypothetical protein DRH14_00835 [Candidatus Shapirobacteria bacterium]|nr:MAG: hypothetical protein DRH14_00835 [Candidatus Shapirobacteria bacterium]
MRHRKFGKKLGRNHHQRQALFKTLLRFVLTYGSIQTTQAKAKAVLPLLEKLMSKISRPSLINRRALYAYLQDRKWVKRVEDTIQKNFPNQHSNFFTTSKIKRRKGDDALIVKLSFVKDISFLPKEKTAKTDKKKVIKDKKKVTKKIKKNEK